MQLIEPASNVEHWLAHRRGNHRANRRGVGRGAGGDPLTVLGAGVSVWLSAKFGVLEAAGDPAEDGDTVQIWTSRGNGGGSDAIQNTAGNRPVYRATTGPGGRPYIDFVTTDSFDGTLGTTAAGDSWSLWVVANFTDVTNRTVFDSSDTTAINRGIMMIASAGPLGTVRAGVAGAFSDCNGTIGAAGTWRRYSGTHRSASRTIYQNNVALSGGVNPETTSRVLAALVNYRVGLCYAGANLPHLGGIAEIIFWRGEATAGQRAAIEGYLVSEWGS